MRYVTFDGRGGITVSELKRQLEALEKLGYGSYEVWREDFPLSEEPVETGLFDVNFEHKTICLA